MLPYRLTPSTYSFKEKPAWCTIYLQYIMLNTSTCFGLISSPSSGGTSYGYNNRYLLFCLMRSIFCTHQCHKHAHGLLACACTRGLWRRCWRYGLWWSTAPSLLILGLCLSELGKAKIGTVLHHSPYGHEHIQGIGACWKWIPSDRTLSTNCCVHKMYLLMMGYRYARNMWRCLTKYTEDKLCIKLDFL